MRMVERATLGEKGLVMRTNIDLTPPQSDNRFWYDNRYLGGMPSVPLHDRRWYPYLQFAAVVVGLVALGFIGWTASWDSWANPL